jgi:hypothetical protein
MLVAGAFLFRWLGQMPRAVLSAVIMVVAIQHFDLWSLRLAGELRKGPISNRYHVALDLAVVIVVAVLSIAAEGDPGSEVFVVDQRDRKRFSAIIPLQYSARELCSRHRLRRASDSRFGPALRQHHCGRGSRVLGVDGSELRRACHETS